MSKGISDIISRAVGTIRSIHTVALLVIIRSVADTMTTAAITEVVNRQGFR
jgi:hypothetical protein